MNFNPTTDARDAHALESPLTIDFAAAAIDMITNVRGAATDESILASSEAALERLTHAARALESEDAVQQRVATHFLIACAHEYLLFVNPWRMSVSSPQSDWVAYYVHFCERAGGALSDNGAMNSIVRVLAHFDGDDSRANLLRHVSNVSEIAASLFVQRAVPVSRKAQAKAQAKVKAQRQKKVASAIASHDHARIMAQAAANTRQLFSNPAIVSKLKETTADLIRASVPDADVSADSSIIDQVFQMSMNSAPSVVEGMAAQLQSPDALGVGGAIRIDKKKLKKVARAAAARMEGAR